MVMVTDLGSNLPAFLISQNLLLQSPPQSQKLLPLLFGPWTILYHFPVILATQYFAGLFKMSPGSILLMIGGDENMTTETRPEFLVNPNSPESIRRVGDEIRHRHEDEAKIEQATSDLEGADPAFAAKLRERRSALVN